MKTPTLRQVLRQQRKLAKLTDQQWKEKRVLSNMAEKLKGESELILDGEQLYRVSIGYGYSPSVNVEIIGSKENVAEIVK